MSRPPAARRIVAAIGAAGAGACLFGLLRDLSALLPVRRGLEAQVAERLAESGIPSAVTAVLLSFRAYDTMLEVAVLLAALLIVGATAPRAAAAPDVATPRDPIVAWYLWAALPLLVLAGAALLAAGTTRPGGAFQGAALLAGAGALLRTPGVTRDLPSASPRAVPAVVSSAGLAGFLVLAFGTLLQSGTPLAWGRAGPTIVLALEAAVWVSLGALLPSLLPHGGHRA